MDFKVLSVMQGHLRRKEFQDFNVLLLIQGHLRKKKVLDFNVPSFIQIQGHLGKEEILEFSVLSVILGHLGRSVPGLKHPVSYTWSAKEEEEEDFLDLNHAASV